jgi:hypothetical protein
MYGGAPKPTLFNIRQWRKSVAVALHLQHHPGLLSLRYEDLVAEPRSVLLRIASFLEIRRFEAPLGRLRDQQGRRWRSNSSHGEYDRVTSASVGRHRDVLPEEVRRFVEATCRPELDRLGYSCELPPQETEHVLRTFRDPYRVEREELRDYLPSARTIADELERIAALEEGGAVIEREYFLYDDVRGHLQPVRGDA